MGFCKGLDADERLQAKIAVVLNSLIIQPQYATAVSRLYLADWRVKHEGKEKV